MIDQQHHFRKQGQGDSRCSDRTEEKFRNLAQPSLELDVLQQYFPVSTHWNHPVGPYSLTRRHLSLEQPTNVELSTADSRDGAAKCAPQPEQRLTRNVRAPHHLLVNASATSGPPCV